VYRAPQAIEDDVPQEIAGDRRRGLRDAVRRAKSRVSSARQTTSEIADCEYKNWLGGTGHYLNSGRKTPERIVELLKAQRRVQCG
jgi:hypothetical protein